jgi:hypothetical protein
MRGPTLVAIALLLLLGGCAGASNGAVKKGPAAFDSSTGSIMVLVSDDQLFPLAGAMLVLDDNLRQSTNESGGAEFRDLAPGPHRLLAAFADHDDVDRIVMAVAGETTRVSLQLPLRKELAPYHTTLMKTGFIACSVTIGVPGQPAAFSPCAGVDFTTGQHLDKSLLTWHLGDLADVVGLWGESTWQATQALGRELNMSVHVNASIPNVMTFVAGTQGKSPIALPIVTQGLLSVARTAGSLSCRPERCELYTLDAPVAKTAGTPVDVGAVVQQRFQAYITVFHKGEMPAAFSAVHD